MKVHNLLVTGSLTSGGENISTISSSVSTTVTELSSSLNSRLDGIQTSTGSLNTFTSSANNRLNSVETSTGSLNTFTSSANNRLNSIESVTGSYATTGSNTFNGNLTVTGFIDAQELRTTYISSSILYRSGSTKFGDELTDTHAFTGSMLLSGSLNGVGVFATSGTGLNASVRINNTTSSTGKDWHLYSLNNGNFGLYNNTDGSYSYILTPSGNLGLGTTPSAWNTTSKALQLPQFVSLSHQHNGDLNLMSFALETSANTFTYADTGVFPARLNMNPNNGSITFFGAGTGTAGNTISWSTRFLISSTGNVGIGTSSPASRLNIVGGTSNAGSTSTSDYSVVIQDPTSMVAGVGGSILLQGYKTSTSAIGNFAYVVGKKENGTAGNEAGYLALGTFDSAGIGFERMRLNSTGNISAGNGLNSTFTFQNDGTFAPAGGGATVFRLLYGGAIIAQISNTGTGQRDGILSLRDEGVTKINIAANASRGGDTYFNNGGRVGINTDSPTNLLHLTGASSTPSLRLGSISAGFHWDIGRENQSTGDFVFNSTNVSTGTTEKMRITQDSVAYLRMASGTGGIQFNGDTAAANALDDYEEGTWTPTLPNGGTLTVLNARYVKIGQKVTVSFYIQLVSPPNNSSDFLIGGLPFANAGYSTFYTAGSFGYSDTANLSGWAPITGLNFSYIYFHSIDGTTASRKTNANYLAVAGGNNQIILTITYFAAT